MKSFLKVCINTTLLTVLFYAIPFAGHSQSVWIEEPDGNTVVGIEALIPFFDEDLGIESPSSAYYIYSHIPVSSTVTLQLDVPISHFSAGDSETSIGNPYVGIQAGEASSAVKFDLGLRIPLSSEDSFGITTGFFSENYMVGPFFPDTFSALANIHYRYDSESGLAIRLDGGPEVLFFEESDNELFIKYGGQILFNVDQFTVGTGINGRLWATQEGLTFSERSINSAGITGSYDFGNVNFGGYVEIPLNDATSIFSLGEDTLKAVFGLNVGFKI